MAAVPGRYWYGIGAFLAVAGAAVAVMLGLEFVAGVSDQRQFVAPGRLVFDAAAPGRYVVWNDHRTVFEGRAYAASPTLPDGLRISILGPRGGEALRTQPGQGLTSKTGATERAAAVRFRVESPGSYEVRVEGVIEPRVMSIGRDPVPRLFFILAGAISALVAGVAAGGALAGWVWLQRNLPARNDVSRHKGEHMDESRQGENGQDDNDRTERGADHGARQITTLVYALQAASFLVGITLVAGVIVNYVKHDEVAGTWLESHFRWQIRTFWFCLLWGIIGFMLMIVAVGFLVLAATAIWLIYRIVKGWLNLSEGKPMYA